jgi:hypothetical protein
MSAMADPLVTVTAYAAPNDARTAQGVLDSAGIPAVIDSAPHKLRVRVPNIDALKAGDVLTARAPALAEIDEADEDERERVCPACGSTEVESARRAQMFALVVTLALAVGVAAEMIQAAFFAVAAAGVFLLIAGRWRCQSCNETWD